MSNSYSSTLNGQRGYIEQIKSTTRQPEWIRMRERNRGTERERQSRIEMKENTQHQEVNTEQMTFGCWCLSFVHLFDVQYGVHAYAKDRKCVRVCACVMCVCVPFVFLFWGRGSFFALLIWYCLSFRHDSIAFGYFSTAIYACLSRMCIRLMS